MNIQFYFEKLQDSEEYQEFLKENSDAFPCSAFFARDFENTKDPKHQAQIDYFIPSSGKAFSFKLDKGIEKVPIENFGENKPKKISFEHEFDFSEIEELIINEIKKREIKNKVQKMLFSMQNLDEKDFFIGTVFVSGMGLLKINIDLSEMKITDFEKKSFFDILNVFKK